MYPADKKNIQNILHQLVRVGRHLCRTNGYRELVVSRFNVWDEVIASSQHELIKRMTNELTLSRSTVLPYVKLS
jgi:hypothetical protein